MQNNYLIEYSDATSYKRQIEELIKKLGFEDSLVNSYDLEENSLDIVLEDLDTYSFLSEKTTIIVKNIQVLDSESEDSIHLLKYLDNPMDSKLLIMLSNNLDSRKKITKDLKKKATYIKANLTPNEVIKKELKDYDLDDGVINLILEYTNSNIDAITSECEKLKLYKETDRNISKNDIKKVCYKRLGDTTELSFDLVREISVKDKKRSLQIYKELHKHNIDDLGIIGLLESQLRLLKQVSILYTGPYIKNSDIASILKVHPYRVEKTIELLRHVSDKEINNLIKDLFLIDYKLKSGKIDADRPLLMYIINL